MKSMCGYESRQQIAPNYTSTEVKTYTRVLMADIKLSGRPYFSTIRPTETQLNIFLALILFCMLNPLSIQPTDSMSSVAYC